MVRRLDVPIFRSFRMVAITAIAVGLILFFMGENPEEKSSRQSKEEKGKDFTVDLGEGVSLEMLWIPGGTFLMGSRLESLWLKAKYQGKGVFSQEETPPHEVELDGFWMGKFEITNAQFRQFHPAHESSSYDKDEFALNENKQPALNVSWHDGNHFCEWLSGKTNRTFSLPSEAQWEYACRAGTDTVFYWGDDITSAGTYANVHDQSAMRDSSIYSWWGVENINDGFRDTAPVGSLMPNAFGLYDMIGNVAELCLDWYDKNYYAQSPKKNPVCTQEPYYPEYEQDYMYSMASRPYKVVRGGSWRDKRQL